jgi:hypothetical protein
VQDRQAFLDRQEAERKAKLAAGSTEVSADAVEVSVDGANP